MALGWHPTLWSSGSETPAQMHSPREPSIPVHDVDRRRGAKGCLWFVGFVVLITIVAVICGVILDATGDDADESLLPTPTLDLFLVRDCARLGQSLVDLAGAYERDGTPRTLALERAISFQAGVIGLNAETYVTRTLNPCLTVLEESGHPGIWLSRLLHWRATGEY